MNRDESLSEIQSLAECICRNAHGVAADDEGLCVLLDAARELRHIAAGLISAAVVAGN